MWRKSASGHVSVHWYLSLIIQEDNIEIQCTLVQENQESRNAHYFHDVQMTVEHQNHNMGSIKRY